MESASSISHDIGQWFKEIPDPPRSPFYSCKFLAEQAEDEHDLIMASDSRIPDDPLPNSAWPQDDNENLSSHHSDSIQSDESVSSIHQINPFPPTSPDDHDSSDSEFDEVNRRELYDALELLEEEESDDESDDDKRLEAELATVKKLESKGWFPFKKKEHVAALLMIESTWNLISRSQYQRLRSIFRICDVWLPDWGALRALKKNLKERLGLSIFERNSPSGTPLFGLNIQDIIKQDLSNPFVSPHLTCLPEQNIGSPIKSLSQSNKWLKGYDKDLRVQMVQSKIGHIYIYEVYQLISSQMVVPVCLFQRNGKAFAKCLQAQIIPEDDISNNLLITIPDEPDFDSPNLHTIDIDLFQQDFNKIELHGVGLLQHFCKKEIRQSKTNGYISLPLTNPWRVKADGKIVKHIPITLYSDDTSGNVSKKYNKHMSLFFTLSGLPPNISNQEYNIHFLATSNCATALDLLDGAVDQINQLSTEGFTAFDISSGQEIMVMVVVLCHLGDLPMHAEICNTTNPANTLAPCRVCKLQVDLMAEKKSEKFVRSFIGLDQNSAHNRLSSRDWNETRTRTIEIWKTAQKPNSKAAVEKQRRLYGLRDTMTDPFIEKVQQAYDERKPAHEVHEMCNKLNADLGQHIFNPMLCLKGFDGHLDTPVKILHVVLLGIVKYLYRDEMKGLGTMKSGSSKYKDLSAQWRSFSTKGLNIPPIQPNTLIQFSQSLVGKEFQVVLQSVPFVLFGHLSASKRRLWISLCLLCSYIFQTEISDLDLYLTELQSRIDIFLTGLVEITAQWVNKPKFHMLTHLPESIRRFGPASLFATQKLESFNGVLRYGSVHSNGQSPGRDIADTFNNRQLSKIMTSESAFHDQRIDTVVTAGPQLALNFPGNSEIQCSLGRNLNINQTEFYVSGSKVNDNDGASIPSYLINERKNHKWIEIQSLTLKNKQKVKVDDFLLMKEHILIGRVHSIWRPDNSSTSNFLLLLKKCNRGRIIPFYGMREVVTTTEDVWIKADDIRCILNVQHNCHRALCSVTHNHPKRIERKSIPDSQSRITHNDLNSYIINSAALYSAESHREASGLPHSGCTKAEWDEAIEKGLNVWTSVPP